MLIQNTNPVNVAPEQRLVKQGFLRDDLFTCVHEQFMTDTAKIADVVLPATMFLEHDDIYHGGGNQHIMLGPKLIDPPGECRSNHFVIEELAQRLGVAHAGLRPDRARASSTACCRSPAGATSTSSKRERWVDLQPPFETAHYLDGFGMAGRQVPLQAGLADGAVQAARTAWARWRRLPALPDHWAMIEVADAEHPFRLATSPARNFLNSTFAETPVSLASEKCARRC